MLLLTCSNTACGGIREPNAVAFYLWFNVLVNIINWGEPERDPPSRFNACAVYIFIYIYTVKPPKRGHFGVGPFVLCREVVLSQRFVFKCYSKFDFNRKQGTYLYTISIHTYSNNNW